jgi:hypothetical protein
LKPERWVSLLVQEKYQEEKTCDKRHPNRVIIIIIIIIIIYDYTDNIWSYWNSNEKLKEKFGSCTRKPFDSFTTKDSYTWNITHNTESTYCSVKQCEA